MMIIPSSASRILKRAWTKVLFPTHKDSNDNGQ
jgi:hypothetical protein